MDTHVLVVIAGARLEVYEIVIVADALGRRELIKGVRIGLVDFGEEGLGEEELADVGYVAAVVGGGFGVDATADMAGDLMDGYLAGEEGGEKGGFTWMWVARPTYQPGTEVII